MKKDDVCMIFLCFCMQNLVFLEPILGRHGGRAGVPTKAECVWKEPMISLVRVCHSTWLPNVTNIIVEPLVSYETCLDNFKVRLKEQQHQINFPSRNDDFDDKTRCTKGSKGGVVWVILGT